MMIRLKRKVLENSYWINIPADSQDILENNIPFLVCVEHTNMISNKYYNNEHIVYCANYLKPGHELFDYSKEQIFGIYFDGLKKLNPKIQRNHVIDFELAKTNYASPVFNVNHRNLIPSFDISILFRPSNEKGLVTTPTVRIPICFAISATIGAPPVPVPPPIPAVINTISAPLST